jgi:hypothetical protein
MFVSQRFFVLLCVSILMFTKLYSQNEKSRKFTIDFPELILEDIFVSAGINRGGIMFSNYHRELRDNNGFQFGVETYVPIQNKIFLNTGLIFVQNRFGHQSSADSQGNIIVFSNNDIQMPIFGSFEMPIMRKFDFRFLLGIHLSYRLWTSQSFPYSEEVVGNGAYHDGGNFHYPDSRQLKRFNGGMHFGLSWEYDNYYFRLRSNSSFNNLYSSEQGMPHAFHIDFGFFPIRYFNRRK